MTLLLELVNTSRRIAETRSRSQKTAALADLLRRLEPEEIEPAVSYLSGQLRQGRIGLGAAAIAAARAASSPAPDTALERAGGTGNAAAGGSSGGGRAGPLTLFAVDAAFSRMAAASGPGSTGERTRLLAGLLAGRRLRDARQDLQGAH